MSHCATHRARSALGAAGIVATGWACDGRRNYVVVGLTTCVPAMRRFKRPASKLIDCPGLERLTFHDLPGWETTRRLESLRMAAGDGMT